jgi:hypothetical protein
LRFSPSRAGVKRVLWCGAVMLLIGPKILLLAPVWATGVVLHRWSALQRVGRAGGGAAARILYRLQPVSSLDLTEAGSAWLRQTSARTGTGSWPSRATSSPTICWR